MSNRNPDAMLADPRKQAWLLWRARLEGGDPLEVVKGWFPGPSEPKGRERLALIYGRLMGDPEAFAFNGSSGNWPWVAAAAKGDLAWAERAAAVDLERGIGRIELGSPSYPERLLAQGYLLWMASGKFAPVAVPSLRECVRRQWLLHSLAMVPSVPTKVTVYGHGGVEVFEGKEAPAHWYSGWTSAMPMTRVSPASMRDSLLSYLVTKAMGAPCTYKRKADSSPESPYWPLYALSQMRGVAGKAPDPDAVVDWADDLERALPGLRTAFHWSLYRTDAGTACWIGWRGKEGLESGPTTFKPTALFNRMDRDGHQRIALPQRWSAGKSPAGRSSFDQETGFVHVNDGESPGTYYNLDPPPGKPTLWLEIGPEGARRVA